MLPHPGGSPAGWPRLVAGGYAVAYMTRLAGAANTRARQQLDWKPTYSSWQDGLAATPPTG